MGQIGLGAAGRLKNSPRRLQRKIRRTLALKGKFIGSGIPKLAPKTGHGYLPGWKYFRADFVYGCSFI